MLALSAVHLVFAARSLRLASTLFQELKLGATAEEVRYMRGNPTQTVGSTGWLYRNDDADNLLAFDAKGRLAQVRCAAAAGGQHNCETIFGLGIGSTEEAVWFRLGAPSTQSFQGDDKIISYDEIGRVFHLKKRIVVAVALRPASTGYWSRLPRLLVP